MTTKAAVEDFLAQRTLAVVGVSRDSRKFGNVIFKDLKKKGYRVYPINPNAQSIEGEPCYSNLASLPEKVGGVILVLPPAKSAQVVREAKAAGIERVWLQQGAESREALEFCQQNGISVVAGECILMFARPIGFFHKPHRWVWGLMGKLPQ
jgi:predicted CoA-binding protein